VQFVGELEELIVSEDVGVRNDWGGSYVEAEAARKVTSELVASGNGDCGVRGSGGCIPNIAEFGCGGETSGRTLKERNVGGAVGLRDVVICRED
jgi:hypothetical protein